MQIVFVVFCFFKQKTAYEMRISDWSSDVCSSDLGQRKGTEHFAFGFGGILASGEQPVEPIHPARRRQEVGVIVGAQRTGLIGQIGRASCRERVCQYV